MTATGSALSVPPARAILSLRPYALPLFELVQALAYLAIVVQFFTKILPVWYYVAAVAVVAAGVARSLSLIQHNRERALWQIAAVIVLSHSGYDVATHFSVLAGGDAYGEYGLLLRFLDAGKISPIDETGGVIPLMVSGYSRWPALQALSIALVRVAGMTSLQTALLLPWIFVLGWLLFAYVLLCRIERDLGLPAAAMGLALLGVATSPFGPMLPNYKYQDMALVLWGAVLYLAYRWWTSRTATAVGLLMLTMAALAVTHHYTSLVAVTWLILLPLAVIAGRATLGWKQTPAKRGGVGALFPLGLFGLACVLMWWVYYAPGMWFYIFFSVLSIARAITTLSFSPSFVHTLGDPGRFTPVWMRTLLLVRDAAMFLPAVAGFIVFVRRRDVGCSNRFVAASALTFGVFAIPDALFGGYAANFRIVWLAAWVVALLTALFYAEVEMRLRPLRGVLMPGVAAVFVAGALIGFGNVRFAPMQFFDPNVTLAQVGENPPAWPQIARFLRERVPDAGVKAFLTDQVFPMVLVLPQNQWSKVAGISYRGSGLWDGVVVVALNDLNTSYINQVDTMTVPGFRLADFRKALAARSLIYDGGQFKVWR